MGRSLRSRLRWLAAPALGAAGVAAAQTMVEVPIHDAARGELSPGTSAPALATMREVIASGNASSIVQALQFGERVACHACVEPVRELLFSPDPDLAAAAARWLAHQPFAANTVHQGLRQVLATGMETERRVLAARALGELHDAASLDPLRTAATSDAEASVRVAAVAALGRLDHPEGYATIVAAMADGDASVRYAALRAIPTLNFFADFGAVDAALGDGDAEVRSEAARVLGAFRIETSRAALEAALGDGDAGVRRDVAWALLRLGADASRAALQSALDAETDPRARDALTIALQ